jgi:hypothetical protein
MLQRGWKIYSIGCNYIMRNIPSADSTQPYNENSSRIHLAQYPDMVIMEAVSEKQIMDIIASINTRNELISFVSAGDALEAYNLLGLYSLHAPLPPYLIIKKALSFEYLPLLVKLGYSKICFVKIKEWPVGGPDPRTQSYMNINEEMLNYSGEFETYLQWCP